MSEQRINLQGAVDLAALAATRKAQEQRLLQAQSQSEDPTGDGQPSSNQAISFNVAVETFEDDVLKQSLVVPVVIVFWTPRSEPAVELVATLEKLAREDNGSWVLAKVDVDDQVVQQVATAFQVQAIPAAFAMIGGQPVPLFQGVAPEHKLREVIDAVVAQGQQLGLPGNGEPQAQAEEAPLDPRLERAQQAIDDGNWDEAISAYQELLKENPKDVIANIGLLNVQLFARVDGVDFDQAISSAGDAVESQLLAADCQFMMNDWGASFNRLIEFIRFNSGAPRDLARERLLQLFEIAGPHDEAVIRGRSALTSALF